MPPDITKSINKLASNKWMPHLIILLVVCVVMLPIPFIGIPDGYDLPQHLQFAVTFYDAILTGDFFPGWAASDNHEYGSIGIRFYPPLAYYLLAFTQMFTSDWYDSYWINSFFWMLFGCAGVYWWAKEWLSSWQSTVAATLYAIAPYHLLQIYQVLLYAEFAASGVLPFCFLFLTRICRRRRTIDVLLFAIAYSLLILTHIPTTIIGTLSFGVYALLLIDWKQYKKTFFCLSAAIALSFSATAFHWLKIITEMNWVKHNSSQFYASGYYNFEQYLFPMIINAKDSYERKMLWHLDIPIVFSIIFLLPLTVFLTLKIRSRKSDDAEFKTHLALSVTGFFAVFMMSLPSLFIWQSISFLQKVQFPWRWLSVASLIGVMSFTFAVFCLSPFVKHLRKLAGYAILVFIGSMLLFNITQNIIPAEPLSREKFEEKIENLRVKEGCNCWWTTWADSNAFKRVEKVSAAQRHVEITRWENESREFIIEQGEPIDIRVATFYYPHWQAVVNGVSVQIKKDADGAILIPVAGERSAIKLHFQEPFILQVALVISLITGAFLIGGVIIVFRSRGKAIQFN